MPGDGRFVKGQHWRPPQKHWQREWLEQQYVTLGRSSGDIAAECGCTDGNIMHWLRKHGIARRTISEARKLKHWGVSGADNPMHGKTGALNPRFVDGSSPERQRMYARGEGRAFIRAVLGRDGYHCRRCGTPNSGRKSLHVHHVKPWAGNAALRLDPNNAVTLCRPCHQWVHSRGNTEGAFL
jgi:thymidylate synthase (FAD)